MKIFLYIATFFMPGMTFAGGSHFHPKKVASCAKVCTAKDIQLSAHLGIDELVKWHMLEAKWKMAKIESVEKKVFTKGSRSLITWVVTLSETTDKKYVFFTEDGMVFRSNDTGVLK